MKGGIDTSCVAISEEGKETSLQLWHKKLAHISERRLHELNKQGLLETFNVGKLSFCEQCLLGKVKRVKFTKSDKNTSEKLDYIHSDFWGPT